MIDYVVFNLATGEPVKAGQCQEDFMDAQAGAGERALPGNSLTVEGNRGVLGNALRDYRERIIDGGAPTPFGVADSDLGSRTNIIGTAVGALLMGNLGQPFSTVWKMADESLVPMDVTQFSVMALSVLSFVNNCHARARELESAILGAANMAELLAIDLESGWPVV